MVAIKVYTIYFCVVYILNTINLVSHRQQLMFTYIIILFHRSWCVWALFMQICIISPDTLDPYKNIVVILVKQKWSAIWWSGLVWYEHLNSNTFIQLTLSSVCCLFQFTFFNHLITLGDIPKYAFVRLKVLNWASLDTSSAEITWGISLWLRPINRFVIRYDF